MRKIFYSFIILCFGFNITGQGVWFDTGLKVQYGGSALLNSVVTANPDYSYAISTGFGIGGKLGVNFDNGGGFALDIMRSNAKGAYSQIGQSENVETQWKSLDLYLTYRSSFNASYIEIGPKLGFLNSVNNNIIGTEIDQSDNFSGSAYAAMFGFGTYLIGSDGRFSGIFGIRLEYGLNDLVNKTNGESVGAPVFDSTVYAEEYSKSNPVFVGVVFELNWGLGYYGKASCGQRGKFIWL